MEFQAMALRIADSKAFLRLATFHVVIRQFVFFSPPDYIGIDNSNFMQVVGM